MRNVKLSVLVKGLGTSALLTALAACGGNNASTTSTSTAPTGVAAFTGNFVFSAVGTSGVDGDYSVVGSLVADGKGNITSAVADYNLGSGIDANVPLTGTYTVAGNVVSVTLTDSKAVTDTFNTSTFLSSGTAVVSNFDGTGSGTLYPQTTSGFSPAGSYTYSVKGEGQGVVTGSGAFVAATSGTFSSGTLTYTDAATTAVYPSITGFLYAPQSTGRGQASLAGNNLAYYVIGPSQILMIGLDERALLLIPAQKS
jgi:hypothetical protein